MIESRWRPAARRVTVGANMAEIRLHMVRVAGRLKIALMAGVAVGRCPRIAGRVTGGAGSIDMLSGQRESCITMVQTRRRPAIGRMTDRAILAEALLHVVRISYTFKIRLVTAVAARRCSCESRTVTLRAEQRGMLTGQRESGRRMVKR